MLTERPHSHGVGISIDATTHAGAWPPPSCLLPDDEQAVERLAAALRVGFDCIDKDSHTAWHRKQAAVIIAALREGGQP